MTSSRVFRHAIAFPGESAPGDFALPYENWRLVVFLEKGVFNGRQ
jgi:hypothetical protein